MGACRLSAPRVRGVRFEVVLELVGQATDSKAFALPPIWVRTAGD